MGWEATEKAESNIHTQSRPPDDRRLNSLGNFAINKQYFMVCCFVLFLFSSTSYSSCLAFMVIIVHYMPEELESVSSFFSLLLCM